jgi:hypothetical protein
MIFLIKDIVAINILVVTMFFGLPHLWRKKPSKEIVIIALQNAISCGFFAYFFSPIQGAGGNIILLVATLLSVGIFFVALIATLMCRYGKKSNLLCFLQRHSRMVSWVVLFGEAVSPYWWKSWHGVVAIFIATTFVRFVCLPDENQPNIQAEVKEIKVRKFSNKWLVVIDRRAIVEKESII